jgi:hypothetical protein
MRMEDRIMVIKYNKMISIAAVISLVIMLLLIIASPFGNLTLTQVALAQLQPDNTYIPYSGLLTTPPEILAIP